MGLFAIMLIVFFMIDPERGQAEDAHLMPSKNPVTDLKALAKNKSYILSIAGFTCVTFTAGCLMWWGPEFAFLGAKASCGAKSGCENITQAEISYRFGIVMTFAGLLGNEKLKCIYSILNEYTVRARINHPASIHLIHF